MKYASTFLKRQLSKNVIIATFFFHGRGAPLQKTKLGLFRSLLNQLLVRVPGILSRLGSIYEERCKTAGDAGKRWDWTEGELRRFIADHIEEISRTSQVVILIDALDECGQDDARDLVKLFDKLMGSQRKSNSALKILFSCRHYPILTLKNGLIISMESENQLDVDKVVHLIFQELYDTEHTTTLESLKEMEREIIERAKGMFQWATLVANEAVKLRTEGKRIATIAKKIRTLPGDLHDLYGSLLNINELEDPKQTVKLFQWIIFAFEPLGLEALQHALANDANTTHSSISELRDSEVFYGDMERAVKNLSRGLAEVKAHDGRQTAQLIHQSVLDYMNDKGLRRLNAAIDETTVGAGHFLLSRSCIRYLLLADDQALPLNSPSSSCSEGPDENSTFEVPQKDQISNFWKLLPLARYAHLHWILHITEVESAGIDQKDLLRILPRSNEATTMLAIDCSHEEDPDWGVEYHEILEKHSHHYLATDNFWADKHEHIGTEYLGRWLQLFERPSLVEIFTVAGIHSAFTRLQRLDPNTYDQATVSGGYSFTDALLGRHESIIQDMLKDLKLEHIISKGHSVCDALFLATAMNREDLVRVLLDVGATVDSQNCSDQSSSLMLAASLGYEAIACTLLDANAEMNLKDEFGCTPLYFAAWDGSDAIVALLLERGAGLYPKEDFVDAKANNGTTPFSVASGSGFRSICRLLRDAGADVDVKADDGETLLTKAIRSGKLEETRMLLDLGVDPNASGREGFSPFVVAMEASDLETAIALLQNSRTDLNSRNEAGRTPLADAVYHYGSGRFSDCKIIANVLQISIDAGRLSLDVRDNNGNTILSSAVERNIPTLVDIILASGEADPNISDNYSCSPLMKAINHHRLTTTTKLLLASRRIDLEAQDERRWTALSHAVVTGNMPAANLLLASTESGLQFSKAQLASACFQALDHGFGGFLSDLPELQPEWFRFEVLQNIHMQALREEKFEILQQLQRAGLLQDRGGSDDMDRSW